MKKILLILLAVLMPLTVQAETWIVYDMDFDVEASTVEAAPEACVSYGPGGYMNTETADCELPMEGVTGVYISWNSVDDVLGTHASTDWSINIRCKAFGSDSYPATGTAPTSTDYWEEDVDLDGQYGGFELTPPSAEACKIRVDADTAAVAAPTVKVRLIR